MNHPLSPLRHRVGIFFHSLRFRLLLWGAVMLLLVLAVFSAIVYYRQAEIQKTVLANRIYSKATFILEAYREFFFKMSGKGELTLSFVISELENASSEKPLIQSNEVLMLTEQDGKVIGQVGELSQEDKTQLSQLNVANISTELTQFTLKKTSAETSFVMISLPGTGTDGRPVPYLFVRTSTPLSPSENLVMFLGTPFDPDGQLSLLAWTLVLASSIVLGLSLLAGYWLTGRLMQPIQAITRTAQEISANDLTRRIRLGQQNELGELADTFDRMLDRLEDAFERQRQFTADASHELRTPLTIVNLEVNRILEDPATKPHLRKSLSVIRDENERMTHLVNNLLVLARADAGNSRIKPELLDLSELTLDVVEHLIPLSQRNSVAISTGEMHPVPVHGDRFYLSQMITNLITNAIKYGAGEKGIVGIETGSRGADSQRWGWLRVEDHGPGISEDHLPHLFDRFYRADSARSGDQDGEEPSDGHGLGLSIVQWVARAHGGEVQVSSQIGHGTVFEVSLPVVDNSSGGTTQVNPP